MSIRALLVDDERPARRKMRRYLDATTDFEIVGEAEDGAEAVELIDRLKPDLVFLDVQMPKAGGFEAVAQLRPPLPEIVFVTAHDQFALKAFEVHALDYLLKPFDEDRFQKVLDRVRSRRKQAADPALVESLQRLIADLSGERVKWPDRVLVTENERSFFVPVTEIHWIEAARNYILLHASQKTHTMRGTLDSIGKKLDPKVFVRVSRSSLVRLDSIRELQPWFHGEYKVVMKDGSTVKWSRRYLTGGLPNVILR